jgi:arginine exporter protein ArgO
MNPFLQGILAGYGIAIPVGAIAILIIETGLRHGFRRGLAAGAGAATADIIYAALAAMAGQTLSSFLAPYADWLRYLSALVLVGIGVFGLWKVKTIASRDLEASIQNLAASSNRDFSQTYLRFTGLTILNPMTIAYFGAIILGGSTELAGWQARTIFVAGAALSSLSWQSFLAAVGALAHRRFSPSVQRAISIVGNLVVIVLGIRMAWS